MLPTEYKFGLITMDDWLAIYKSLVLLRQTFKHINIFEIGARTCLTGRAISQACKDMGLSHKYFGVDPKQKTPHDLPPQMKFFQADANNKAFLQFLPPKLHFIFHDPCHCEQCLLHQFLLYTPRLITMGIIAIHDAAPRQQGKFIPESHNPGKDIRVGITKALIKLRMNKRGYDLLYKTGGPRGLKVYQRGARATS